VGYDSRIPSRPAWLQAWTDSSSEIQGSDAVFRVYEKDFAAGRVVLGGNDAMNFSMYMVAITADGGSDGGSDGDTGGSSGGNTGGSSDTPSLPATADAAGSSGGGALSLPALALLISVLAFVRRSRRAYVI
jgi:hypothetical protein